jgi:N-acetylglucosamine malate deacetylase 2
MNWPAKLASGAPVAERVAIVVAHADDETLWTGSLLPRLGDALLIHLTDSAPHDMADARRLGIATRDEYAALREAELRQALVALGATPERLSYGIPDQGAAEHLPALADRLAQDCAGAAAIVTHPYEGGHPDHDAAAHACRTAADRLGLPLVEFACYHEADGERVFGRFWPGPAEHSRPLLPDERDRVAAALACHASQRAVFGDWLPYAERWRDAPRYDFTAPPPPGASLYDRFGWAMTSARFRQLA